MVKEEDLSHMTPSLERKRPNIKERQEALARRLSGNSNKEDAAHRQRRMEDEMRKRSKGYGDWLDKSKQTRL